MRVACPSCAAEYDLPPAVVARLSGGKTVRCTRCGTAWAPDLTDTPPVAAPPAPPPPPPVEVETPLEVPPPPAEPMAPSPAPLRAPPDARGPGRRPVNRLGLAWAASLLILVGAALAAWHWRVEVVAAWPPAARAYMALGLAG